ncbi:placenta growth factor isoform X1 [Pseudorca crassidens]|uniref:placenta growth factor isoform X1 n=1 Tax=Pseudorca crassidens TaxID=82174 RepID=UPI00122F12E7|nr:placenta growth factor isoform X3 [Globicephala melas]
MPAMRLFTCFLQLLAGLALPAVPPQQWALSAANGSSEVEVVPFQEVWGRSYCRALERLVDIVSEYPGEVEHMFSPSCVSLLRCTGCCGDENLHCVPVETVNVTMQLLKIRSGDRPSYVELTFSQHVRCECRPLREKMKPERRRPKGRGKRKREKQRHTDCHLACLLPPTGLRKSFHAMGLGLAKSYPMSPTLHERRPPPHSVKIGMLGRILGAAILFPGGNQPLGGERPHTQLVYLLPSHSQLPPCWHLPSIY